MKYRQIVQHGINSFSTVPHGTYLKSYVLVDKRFFHLYDRISFNLYFHEKPSHMTLFLQSKSVIDKKKSKKIEEIEDLYTSKMEQGKYETFKKTHLEDIVSDDTLSLDEKTEIIYESTTELSSKIFENPKAMDNVRISKEIVNPILKSVFY